MIEQEDKRVMEAGKYSRYNREILNQSELCGCYFCKSEYHPEEIKDWVDGGVVKDYEGVCVIERGGVGSTLSDYITGLEERGIRGVVDMERLKEELSKGDTAICPVCGIDSVVGEKSLGDEGIERMGEYLEMMRDYMFGGISERGYGIPEEK